MEPPMASPNQEGPSEAPPQLPEGWLAQWESTSRKYYYVQRATGHSQWDIPTQPALSVPTPETTPHHADTDPFQKPPEASSGEDGGDGSYEGTDRGFLSDLAMNAVMGGKQHNKPQSGLGGLASSFLSGGSSHGNNSGGGGGTAGLLGSLLGGGGKPQKPQTSSSPGEPTGYGTSSSGSHQQPSGLMGFLGGHTKPSSNGYGYSSAGQTSGSSGYSAQPPPTSYQPPGQHGQNYGPTGGEYRPPGQSQSQQTFQGQQPAHNEQRPPVYGGQPSQQYTSLPQSQYGGSNPTTPYGPQHTSYPLPPSVGGYNQYPPPPQQHYPPPPPPQPQQNPSFQQQPGPQSPYEMYQPGPPIPSHPGQQGPPPSQQGQYSSASYPGQYGAPSGQAYGQPHSPQPGAYGQGGSQYPNYGAPPPAPGWRT